MSASVMSTSTPQGPVPGTPERVRDEAGTEEVRALAAFLSRPAHVHVPQQRQDDDEDDVLEASEHEVDAQHVLPRQRDEFTCASCFLVAHVSRRAVGSDRCLDCG